MAWFTCAFVKTYLSVDGGMGLCTVGGVGVVGCLHHKLLKIEHPLLKLK